MKENNKNRQTPDNVSSPLHFSSSYSPPSSPQSPPLNTGAHTDHPNDYFMNTNTGVEFYVKTLGFTHLISEELKKRENKDNTDVNNENEENKSITVPQSDSTIIENIQDGSVNMFFERRDTDFLLNNSNFPFDSINNNRTPSSCQNPSMFLPEFDFDRNTSITADDNNNSNIFDGFVNIIPPQKSQPPFYPVPKMPSAPQKSHQTISQPSIFPEKNVSLVTPQIPQVKKDDIQCPAGTKRSKPIPKFKQIRCICGDDDSMSDDRLLVECLKCRCYLHEDCLGNVGITELGDFECPFCTIQVGGDDLFSQLRKYIDQITLKFVETERIVEEAISIEDEYFEQGRSCDEPPDYQRYQRRSLEFLQRASSFIEEFVHLRCPPIQNGEDGENGSRATMENQNVDENGTYDEDYSYYAEEEEGEEGEEEEEEEEGE